MRAAPLAAGHRPVHPPPPGARSWDLGLVAEAPDGVRLRVALWRAAGDAAGQGLAVFAPGRGEYLEKASLPVTALAARGYDVVALDWRGQGLSDRLGARPMVGHVDDFADFGADLAAVLALPEVAALGPPVLAAGHSMGGCILLGAVAAGALAPGAMVLSAPMLGLGYRPAVRLALRTMARVGAAFGLARGWPPVTEPERPYLFRGFEDNCVTGDRGLYDWQVAALRAAPSLQIGLPSYGWLAAAFRAIDAVGEVRHLGCPALLLVGSREGIVSHDAIVAAAARLDQPLARFDGARHDLFHEDAATRAAVWARIDAFLASAG
ncbi:MAG: alpha/beta hydrolase [Pseudomonadota bacterium]